MNILIPEAFKGLFTEHRYYVYYGGRGSAKSHSIARYLIIAALNQHLKILCTREIQSSIIESVHALLKAIITQYDLHKWFTIKNTEIETYNGSLFIFKGLAHNIEAVKSTEGVDLCWIEEADKVSQNSWDILIPTIRKPNSKFIISFNPTHEDDPVYQMFVIDKQPSSIVKKVNYSDNPHFPTVLMDELRHLRETDYERYLHVWEGELRTISDAQVFKGKYVVKDFSSEGIEAFYHGMDFGFANDPSTVVRCFIRDKDLYIDKEAYGHHIEMKDLGKLIKKVIAAKNYKIFADCSRPETISFLKNNPGDNWNIHPCDKWPNSVIDGCEFIRGAFDHVIIHPCCVHTIEEFKRYSFKIDKHTNEVLPIIVDDYNHCLDSLRYSLNSFIKRKVTIYDKGFL
jgi:phage terminase large subunit